MKKYIEAVNQMNRFSFGLLRFCLALVLLSILLSLLYFWHSSEYEREIMRLFLAQDLQYIFTAISISFVGSAVFELQLKQDGIK